jgi:maltooligosyltrehalose trehalohydrolase
MTRLRVWAPAVKEATAVMQDGRRMKMERERGADGWWSTVEDVAPGTDYRFSLDGGRPLPDPRSPWQPSGVDGPSRTVDLASFEWSDEGWRPPALSSGLIYEAHVGTFSEQGTFEGAIEHLDHLVELGVTHLQLMPVAEFPGHRGWGYDGVDLYAPHSAYGGPAGFARLVDESHRRGLAVLLDVVYNHLGPSGNYLAAFGPYFTDRYKTPWGPAVNLDGAGSDEVRRFFIDNALVWLRDYHIDGLRLDAVHAIVDTSAVHFLEQLASEVKALGATLGHPLTVIAESDLNDPRIVRDVGMGGYGLDAQWSDDFHHALHALLTGEQTGYYMDFGSLSDVAVTLRQGYRYAGDYSRFRQRRHGRPSPNLDGRQLLGYLQTHDQVGNRAQGERSSALMSSRRLTIGAAAVLAGPFVPMLFQGEEWAASTPFLYFTSHHDAGLGRAVSAGRRAEFAAFGWAPDEVPDPQAPETFERSKLDWSELEAGEHARLLDWHRRLIALRRSRPDLMSGTLAEIDLAFNEGERWLRFTHGEVTVAFNLADEPRSVPVPADARVLLGSDPAVTTDDVGRLILPPDSVAILGR